jgi:two-component system nitrate/nitrite sensor histidine kinase NarX
MAGLAISRLPELGRIEPCDTSWQVRAKPLALCGEDGLERGVCRGGLAVKDIPCPNSLAGLKPGNHLCCLYETEDEHRAVLTLFLRQGLEQGEKVLCIVDGSTETVFDYLRGDGLEVEPYLTRGQLAFRTHEETYMSHATFDPEAMIALLRVETEQARIEGYSALRVTDEMTWVSQGLPGSERLTEYEARLNDFLPGTRCLVLYRYDRRRCDPGLLLNVLRAHPVAMVGTQIYDNPYYIPPTEYLSHDLSRAELRHWVHNLAERRQMYEDLQKQTRDLEERVKELNCLFAISNLVEEPGITKGEIFQRIVDLVPPAWRHPESTCARITLEDQIYQTDNFQESHWTQVSDIVLQGERIGTLEVCYLGEKPETGETPFLKEEDRLLNAISERLGRVIERVQIQHTLEQHVEERTREIERRRQVAEGLRDILAVLNSNRSLDDVLDFILDQASRLLGAEAVAIYRLQGNGELLTIQASHGLESDYVADANIPVGQSVTGRAVLERQPVTLPDIAAFSRDDDLMVDQRRRALLERLVSEYRALLAVPLKNVETFGAITLYYHEPKDFTDEEIETAVAFGDQVALAIQNAQLRDQVEESAVAAERSRLARELHDAVTQILFSVSLTAEVLPTVWERDPYEGQQALDEMRELTRGALAEMRTLLMELRPEALLKARIDDLLRQLAEGIIGRSRVPVEVTIKDLHPLPSEIKVALFRIAQEALNNVAKHAEASQAAVYLNCYPPVTSRDPTGSPQNGDIKEAQLGRVELMVSDDGRGFHVDQVSPDHLGLAIMRERAAAIGATLEIESRIDQGTQVIVTWRNRQLME